MSDSLSAGSFKSVLNSSADIDEFTIKAPSGAFGQVFKVTITSLAPSGYSSGFYLYYPKIDPNNDPKGSLMAQLKKSPVTLWVALKANVATKFSVAKEEWPWPVAPWSMLSYQVDVEMLSIQDSDEPNDTGDPATPLTKDVPKSSRMAGVIDADSRTVGLSDWFSIEQSDCVVDCFDVTKPYDTQLYALNFCTNQSDDCVGGKTKNLARACSSGSDKDSLGADNEEVLPDGSDKARYFKVQCTPSDCPVFGEGDIPASYQTLSTYVVKWSEKCKYDKTSDKVHCDRETPGSCK